MEAVGRKRIFNYDSTVGIHCCDKGRVIQPCMPLPGKQRNHSLWICYHDEHRTVGNRTKNILNVWLTYLQVAIKFRMELNSILMSIFSYSHLSSSTIVFFRLFSQSKMVTQQRSLRTNNQRSQGSHTLSFQFYVLEAQAHVEATSQLP